MYICDYRFCEKGRNIKDINDGVFCSNCEKPFHKDCFEKHNPEKHNGKAIVKSLKEPK